MAKKKSKKTSSTLYGNYSVELKDHFEELNIFPGDRISVVQGSKKVIGNLLSQNELGNPNNILVKLDNGYNIGVSTHDNLVLKKLKGSVELESFNIKIPKQKKGLPKIRLLGTGGTIASRIDYQTGGVVMAMEPEEIFTSLPELFDEVTFDKVTSLFNMASEDIASKQWQEMAKETADAINDGIKGVLLLHGTDTMGYSSAALSFMLPKLPVPVVFTGAQRSSDRGSFDGALNIISAARIAANADMGSVVVCMHESSNDDYCQISRGTKVRKMHTTRRDAFQTINDTPFARINMKGVITESNELIPRRKTKVSVDPLLGYDEKVALIKVFPGINPDLIDYYIDHGYKGLIIEGTGLGHVPTFPPENENRNFMASINRALDSNIFVGMTSQCLNGRVHPYVYRATRTAYQSGVVYLEDMLPETALVKLGWSLGNFDETSVTKIMLENRAGELSDRSYYKEYA